MNDIIRWKNDEKIARQMGNLHSQGGELMACVEHYPSARDEFTHMTDWGRGLERLW